MEPLKQEFIDLSDKFFARFTERIDGLGDEEYLWEPAPDCWSLVPDRDGKLALKWGLIFDEVAPVTTIAWRYVHIIDLLSEDRCARNIGLEPEPENLFENGVPGTAASARGMLDEAFARWKRYVSATDESKLFEKIGPVAGQWADLTRATFILHILDEVIHHGAEIGVLRDLYRAEQTRDADVSALLKGEDIGSAALEDVKRRRPDMTLLAAATANWDAIPRLLDLGFGVEGRNGRSALHHAAAEGRIDLIERLLEAGADLDAKDPIYQARPVEWAQYFDRSEAVDFLRGYVSSS
jgi:hypothetical protein